MRNFLCLCFLTVLCVGESFAKTDISISISTTVPDTLCEHYSLTITAVVKNNGSSAVTNTPVEFYAKGDSGNILLKKDTVKLSISPGGSWNVTWVFTPGKNGRYKFLVFHARTDDSVSTNDTASFALYIKPGTKAKFVNKIVSVCKGDSATLEIITDAATVQWYDLTKTGRPPVATSKKYTFLPLGSLTGPSRTWKYRVVVLYTGHGKSCDFVDTAAVIVYTPPKIELGANRFICNGDSAVLDPINPNCNYVWSTGQTTQKITVKKRGMYKVWGTDKATGCSSVDSVFIDMPYPDISKYKTACEGDMVYFDCGYTADSYSWDLVNQKSTLAKPSASYKPGDYTITLKITKGSCTTQISQKMHVYPKVTADYSVAGQCQGEPVTFQAITDTGHAASAKFNWKFDDGYADTSARVTHAFALYGLYYCTLTVTNSNGCSASIEKSVLIYAPPDADFTIQGDTLTAGSGMNYEWYAGSSKIPGANAQVYVASKSGYYKVSYENTYGCRGFSLLHYVSAGDSSSNSIAEDREGRISIYPNPGRNHFQVKWNGNFRKITVIDASGKTVITKTIDSADRKFDVDLTSYGAGIYLIRLEGKGSVAHTKLFKL
jgi:hypothetical protein